MDILQNKETQNLSLLFVKSLLFVTRWKLKTNDLVLTMAANQSKMTLKVYNKSDVGSVAISLRWVHVLK